ncbi:hypothetical protein RJ035_001821 [Blastomyces gilchristii]
MEEKVIADRLASSPAPSSSTKKDGADIAAVEIDLVKAKALVKKVDRHIVPFLVLLYVFSFLDRVNIGNARLYDMESDLGLTASGSPVQPRNPKIHSISLHCLHRRIMGDHCHADGNCVEAGLFPGLVAYMTLFYGKREIALRVGYLFSAAALAGACGGLLAYAIGFMSGVAGQKGWRWILIIEGIPSVLIGVATWFGLADDPDTAYYLNAEERELMRARRSLEIGQTDSAQQFHKEDAKEGAKDWTIWLMCLSQYGVDTVLYGYSTFLPTIINGIGNWTVPQVQALTIPCYALGAITYLVVAWFSDRMQRRAIFTIAFCIIAMVGYGVLMSDSSAGVHYFGCFLVAIGLYVCVGLPLAWLPTNLPRFGKRTFATGLQLTLGNVSGIMTPFLYLNRDGPRYLMGHGVTLALTGFSAAIFAFMWFHYKRINKRRAAGLEDDKIAGMTEEEISEMGDRNPRFRYVT